MVRCDGASYRGATGADSLEGGGCATMLEDDAELGELLMEGPEGGEEGRFSVEDRDSGAILGSMGMRGRGGHFSVEVENHVLLLHLCKYRVESLVIDDAGRGVLRICLGTQRLDI